MQFLGEGRPNAQGERNPPYLTPVHPIIVVLPHQPPQEFPKDRLVVYHRAHDIEALGELPPDVIHAVVLLHGIRLGDRRPALDPPDPPPPPPIRERLGGPPQGHVLARPVAPGIPDGHAKVPRLAEVPEAHDALGAVLGRGQVRHVDGVDVHAGLVQQGLEDEVHVDDGVQVGVEDGALGHPPDDPPQLGALHAGLGEGEHHAAVHGAALAHGEAVLVLGRPERALLLLADLVDYATGLPGDGRQALAERVVWRATLVMDVYGWGIYAGPGWRGSLLLSVATHQHVASSPRLSGPRGRSCTSE